MPALQFPAPTKPAPPLTDLHAPQHVQDAVGDIAPIGVTEATISGQPALLAQAQGSVPNFAPTVSLSHDGDFSDKSTGKNQDFGATLVAWLPTAHEDGVPREPEYQTTETTFDKMSAAGNEKKGAATTIELQYLIKILEGNLSKATPRPDAVTEVGQGTTTYRVWLSAFGFSNDAHSSASWLSQEQKHRCGIGARQYS